MRKIHSQVYEEEDFSLSDKEWLFGADARKNRTFAGFLFLVLECFIPKRMLNQWKDRGSAQN